ncbi:uncharacterized protein [Primulina eburnea]|uniref:uncharacterized protein n=1 Tax=Primulina eburnea TaxID=1245227 RepID=UPI003C6C16D0
MQTRSRTTHDAQEEHGRPPPARPQQEEFLITSEVLKALMEEAASKAAAEAVERYLAARQQHSENRGAHGEGARSHHSERVLPEREVVGTNNVPPTNLKKGTALQDDEAHSQAPPSCQKLHAKRGEEGAMAFSLARCSPFTTTVLAEMLPLGLKIANLPEYKGEGDPQDHLDKFYAKADLYDISDAAYCKIFRTTLSGQALTWFNKLPPGTIGSLDELIRRFLQQFSINRKYPKTASYLFTIVQREGESLREFVQRFTQAVHEVPYVNHDLLAGIMQQNLRHRRFKESIAGKPPSTLEELLERAEKYIRIEEAVEPRYLVKRKREDEKFGVKKEERQVTQSPHLQHIPLNSRLTDILVVAEKQGLLQPPRPMKENSKRQQSDKYCRFHKDKGHTTEDCFVLRAEIEKLIKRGYLGGFVDKSRNQQDSKRPEFQRKPSPLRGNNDQGKRPERIEENLPTGGIIAVISGGPACGDSNRTRKTLIRAALQELPSTTSNKSHTVLEIVQSKGGMVFGDSDLEFPRGEHNDTLVISATISNFWVKKILVDSGSSADIIFYSAFVKLGIDNALIAPVNTPLVGFAGEVVEALGEVVLPISLGSYPLRTTKMVKFLVVKSPSAYNIILGRPSLNLFQAIGSTYHMKLKFPTPEGIGEATGDSRLARECHAITLQGTASHRKRQAAPKDSSPRSKQKLEHHPGNNEIHIVENESGRDERLKAAEVLKSIEVIPGKSESKVKVGTGLPTNLEEALTAFLRNNADVFAWKDEALPGIPQEYALHNLRADPKIKPIKQKKRTFGLEKSRRISEEVEKLLTAKYIHPVMYPEWLSNVVLVPKPGNKWRLCIDFTDLNKACPKDPFPLPRIDSLVDSTAGCEMLSFLDAYQGYNQIRLAPEDQEKTSFVTDRGIYCFEVMPFGLKNAGATYQRLVNKMFEKTIGRNMEVYIDDMLVKSMLASTHTEDLRECFDILRKYKMKLNPEKCTFGVGGGKFLGYMVSVRGIEANPEKISAVLNMSPPKTLKGIQELTGRIAALNRFISRSADKGLPFFKVLRQGSRFKWTDECQQAFSSLKKYLTTSPLLVKPCEGDTLFLYLAVSAEAISAVLTLEEGREHKPVYYVSKTLQGAEFRYTNIEKLALALVTAGRKLRPYLQSHQVVVLTNHPLKKVLSSPEASGRMVKWAVELSEYGLEYQPRPAVKAQVLADFIVEMEIVEAECSSPTWTLFVDGSSTASGSGAGILLENPQGDKFQYSIRLQFSASNNEAEYEAIILGLKLALAAGSKRLVAHSDSQLVVNQLQGTYEAKEEKMARYVLRVNELLSRLENYEIKRIPRAQNELADRLAKMASSMTNIDSRRVTFLAVTKEEAEGSTLDILCAGEGEPSWKDEIINFLEFVGII